MARLARIVVPDVAHHVTQRGNRRQSVFFSDDDYARYRDLIAEFAEKAGTRILAYCLMPNHVHFAMVPSHADGLRATFGEAHRRYTRHINWREDWRGHLWQERFHSFPLDEAHLWSTLRYIELNPVKAGLVNSPVDWPWSSAGAHLENRDDPLIERSAGSDESDAWASYLAADSPMDEADQVQRHLQTGRPLGDDSFIQSAEHRLERKLTPKRPGPAKCESCTD